MHLIYVELCNAAATVNAASIENVIFVSTVVCRCLRSIYAMYSEFLLSFLRTVTLLLFAKCDTSMPVYYFLNICILILKVNRVRTDPGMCRNLEPLISVPGKF